MGIIPVMKVKRMIKNKVVIINKSNKIIITTLVKIKLKK
jgi:hypothetical protein